MKCRYSENDIALFLEQDIALPQGREIEKHLAICDACREFADELRESQSVFKSLRQDMVSAGALVSVRTKVLAEVGARRVRPALGRWIYALAGASFVAVMAIGVAQYEHVRKPVAPPVQQIVKSDALPRASQAAVPLTRATLTAGVRKPKARARVSVPLTGPQEAAHAEISTEPPKQLVVKLLTDDPNIVIYWLVDEKNGGTL
jgi:anti-sigma factor RsiW